MPRVRAVIRQKEYLCDRCGLYGNKQRLTTGERVCQSCYGKASGQERGTEPLKIMPPYKRGRIVD